MNELFIVRWPRNVSSVYVNGSTIRYFKNRNVYYANEVLSPGQIICSWTSESNYLLSGIEPSLPLLLEKRQYDLKLKIKADNDLPVQLQITFFDSMHQKIKSLNSTSDYLKFVVPNGTKSYEINLVNLKHRWILFDYLSINEVCEDEFKIKSHFEQHYDWIHVATSKYFFNKNAQLIVNTGPKNVIPILIKQRNYDYIFVYTDEQKIGKLINDLHFNFLDKCNYRLKIVPGIGFYTISDDITQKMKMNLELKIYG